MLLTIRAAVSGTDLGYLLHKNPSRLHTFDLPFGKAHVFYPHLTETVSEAALLVDVNPVGLVRGSGGGEGLLDQYVNDRPYAACSFLSVAIARVLRSAMAGASKERQELADQPLDLEARMPALPCKGHPEFLRELFCPLGYSLTAVRLALDERFPEWGDSPYYSVTIAGRARLRDLLTHIYVLTPVLDSDKHYWAGADEVEKLLKRGEGWLATHPAKEAITRRYLRHDSRLTRDALRRLLDDEAVDPEANAAAHARTEEDLERPSRLWEQRIGAVVAALRAEGVGSVVDLGCGEGKLIRALLEDRGFERIAGMDVSWRVLELARKRLRLEQMSPALRQRVELIHGALTYRDERLSGFDAATLVEVIEHLDPARLAALERVVFEFARPRVVVVTTPNSEYNVRFPTLRVGAKRHDDHRFEWTRAEFSRWACATAERFGYAVRFLPIGPEDAEVGPPTQMGVFTR
ncbi:MAG: 3' terminal RNA ribose 2'-O-methyltransferase Hen1 [Bryobacteraceae bacterium]